MEEKEKEHRRRTRRRENGRRVEGREATSGEIWRERDSMWRNEKVLKVGLREGREGFPREQEVTRRNQSREIKEMELVLCDFYSASPSF